MDFQNLNKFKEYVEGFMKYHNLIGIEMLLSSADNDPVFRACGEGMIHPSGGALEGVEIWMSLDSILKDELS